MKSLFLYFIFYIFFHFGFLFSIFPQLFSVEANITFLLRASSKSALQVFLTRLKFCTIVVFPAILPVSAHAGFYLPVHNKNPPAPRCGVQAGFCQILFWGRFRGFRFQTVFLPHRAKFTADRPCEATGQAAAKTQGQSSTCSWSVLTTITPLMTFTLPVDGQFGISWNSCVSRLARYSSWLHCSNFRPNRYIKSFR